ncbi:class I SAM-dependent methyltransferase [Polaribacter aestuariivivens]|nr:class I SAM-dependent methyltransferase [Polaribacter aestuariivivens]
MKNKPQKNKKPWPTKKAMQQIYEQNLWGGFTEDFYSGDGSHNPKLVSPYLKSIQTFLVTFNNPITVCDLGCGDFNIGINLLPFTKKYFAIDIVPELIKRNDKIYKAENLEFLCLDIAKDNVPKADCVIIRQVLQHLSNAEVQNILQKLYNFKYVILTEHLPSRNFESNKDIISGQGIRLKKQSGINILKPPFNFKVKEEKQLISIELPENKGKIVTNLYTVF